MNRRDGRLEPGQPLAGAITAAAWNRAQDAADVVLGATPGIRAGDGYSAPHRVIVTMQKQTSSQNIYIGNAVEFLWEPGTTAIGGGYIEATNWPPNETTFNDTLARIDAKSWPDSTKQQERQRIASYLTPHAQLYSCRLLEMSESFSGEEVDFFPNVGICVADSKAGESAVRVCISGPALAYVRVLTREHWLQPNICAIRPRNITGIKAPINNARGCLDSHRGGNIRITHWRQYSGNFPFPAILLVPVML